MKKYIFAIIFILIISSVYVVYPKNKMQETKEKVNLVTEDGVNLVGSFYLKDSETAVILVHMLNSNKESYNGLAEILNKDYAVLSFDSRGHGESDLNWNDFSDEDFNKMVLDIKSAKKFLFEKGYKNIYLIGASIGANTVLNYASSNEEIKKIVLLSPGLDYRGVSTEESIRNFKGSLLIISSEGGEYSFSSSEKLFSESLGNKKIIKLEGNKHGTNMLDSDLMDKIKRWLEE